MILDSDKLGRVREAVDLAVIERALVDGVSRRAAAERVAEALGHRVRRLQVDGRWVGYAVPVEVWTRATRLASGGHTIRAAGTELFEKLPWHYTADDADEATDAVLCRLLDPMVDLARPGGSTTIADRDLSMSRWFVAVRERWTEAESPAGRSQRTPQRH